MEECKLATINDINEILELCELVKKTFPLWNSQYPSVDNFIEDLNSNSLFIYTVDGKIVSVIGAEDSEFDNEALSLHMFMTHPDYRKKGYGRKVFVKAEEELFKRVNTIDLLVRNDHPFSLKLYEKWGYENKGKVEVPWEVEKDKFYIYLKKSIK